MRCTTLPWILLAVAAGCADTELAPTADEPEPGDVAGVDYAPLAAVEADPIDAPDGVADDSDDVPTGTGRLRTIRVATADGEADVVVEEHADGRLLLDGDMQVGTVADLQQRASRTSDLTLRWPDGVITFQVGPSWDLRNADQAAAVQRIRRAMDRIAQRSPLRFVEDSTAADRVVLRRSTSGNSAELGFRGGVQDYGVGTSTSFGRMMHEMLHAAGVTHEHQRSDRDLFVRLDNTCRQDTDTGNVAIRASDDAASRFDFSSVMLYSSAQGCKKDTTDRDGDRDVDECSFRDAAGTDQCWVFENLTATWCPADICVDEDGDGTRERIQAQRRDLGLEDINGLYAMYGKALGQNELRDGFGQAMIRGDFDGDGYGDLAVGAPAEAPGSDPASGVVYVFKGSLGGVAPWKLLTQQTRTVNADGTVDGGLASNDAGDGFGTALAVGDFNGDGVDDLAVGAPGETFGAGTESAGAVFVYTGHRNDLADARHGLVPWVLVHQGLFAGAQREKDDRFGAALTAGNFDRAGGDELVVGAPGEAPGDQPRAGAAFVFGASGGGLALRQTLTAADASGTLVDNQRFASALASGDFDRDGKDDLAIGAPGHTVGDTLGAGGIAIFRGSASLTGWRWFTPTGARVGAHFQFGFSLAAGELDGRGGAELAVGAPLDGGGRVYVYRVADGAASPTLWTSLTQTSLGSGDDAAADLFGAHMSIGLLDNDAIGELVVGVPREAGSDPARTVGQAVVVKGSADGLSLLATTRLGTTGAGIPDSLGTRVLIANLDGQIRSRLLVSVPHFDDGGTADVGAVVQFELTSGALAERARIWQETKGAGAR